MLFSGQGSSAPEVKFCGSVHTRAFWCTLCVCVGFQGIVVTPNVNELVVQKEVRKKRTKAGFDILDDRHEVERMRGERVRLVEMSKGGWARINRKVVGDALQQANTHPLLSCLLLSSLVFSSVVRLVPSRIYGLLPSGARCGPMCAAVCVCTCVSVFVLSVGGVPFPPTRRSFV